jgi:DNA-binding NarL/FixJ family response regulator
MKLLINSQPDMEVIGEAGDGVTAVHHAQVLLPDIVLMDISMPPAAGYQATVKITRLCPQVKVVALTRHAEMSYLRQMVRAGASGYVLKQSPSAELLCAIRGVGEGRQHLDPAMARAVRTHDVNDSAFAVIKGQPWIGKREEEVLKLIGWGYSNREVAAQLGISVKTVETHRANAMRKLGLKSRVDIVRFALTQGWLAED